jgi:hypothetical protein
MSGAELAARRTAAAAALADFNNLRQDREPGGLTIATWAARLAAELGSLLEQLGRETPSHAADLLAQIRLVLDAFDWETTTGDR